MTSRRVRAITSRLPLKVVEDTLDGERQRYAAALILVRPDQFVAWSHGSSAAREEVHAILQQVSGLRGRVAA